MITWNWSSKLGKIFYEGPNGEYQTYLYNGNAMLIEIWEEKPEEKTGKYHLHNFLCDKQHFKNCLKDRNGDWLFNNMKTIVIYEYPKDKDLWIWIQEAFKRGIKVILDTPPF